MIQIDLITGFLGSGKTTFIRQYAAYLLRQGYHIGILENDYGAVNVDALLLQDILNANCSLEMVAGGCDADCHRRRFKTKLIAMGMCGYDRILVEPSGIFDMDEFFDILHEEPLNRWYEIGSVITIIDAGLPFEQLSDASAYLLASQAAQAGMILYSHTTGVSATALDALTAYIHDQLRILHCDRTIQDAILTKDWSALSADDFHAIMHAGYHTADYAKLWIDDRKTYDSLYFMNMDFSEEFLKRTANEILHDSACGRVFRIKGFLQLPDDSWIAINATHQDMVMTPISHGQAILIVIGESLCQQAIEQYWGSSRP